MTPTSRPPSEDRVRFGARLRQQREVKALSVGDVVKVTKIPAQSLQSLEAGALDELPAEVFVRGFLKSYCRAVGLEADAILRDYEGLLGAKKTKVPSLARLGTMRNDSSQVAPVPVAPPPVAAAAPSPSLSLSLSGEPALPPPEKTAAEKDKEELGRFAALADIGKGSGRTGLTVAVIILVIVATVTLSLLLRRPGRVGNGVSLREVPSVRFD